MRLPLALCVIVSVCLFPGCWVSSVHPLAEPDSRQAILLPELEGTWEAPPGLCEEDEQNKEIPCILRIKREVPNNPYGGGSNYRYYDIEQLTAVTSHFKGTVVQLGQYRFLDTIPTGAEPEAKMSSAVIYHLFVAHTVWKIEVEGDSLRLALPDTGFLHRKWRDEPPKGVAVYFDCGYKSDCYLLTLSTPELQQFYLKYASNPEAYVPDHKFVFTRKADAAAKASNR